MKTIDQIVLAVQRGEIDPALIDRALSHVDAFAQIVKSPTENKLKESHADKVTKASKYRDQAYQIERKSITLVQNLNNTLPLAKTKGASVGICGTLGVDELQRALEKYLKMVPAQIIATAKHGGDIYDFEIERVKRTMSGAPTIVFTVSSDIRTLGQNRLLRELKAMGSKVIVVHVGYPSSIASLKSADAIMLAYCDTEALEESMRAVADTLMGEGSLGIFRPYRELRFRVNEPQQLSALDVIRVPSGRLPISLDPPFEAGFAVTYNPTFAVKSVEWDFGDKDRSKGLEIEKTYKTAGNYTLTMTLTDSKKTTVIEHFPVVVE